MIDFIDTGKLDANTNETNQIIEQYISENGKVVKAITNLAKVNIFVGENNSGKSRLLREIAKNSNFKYYELKDYDINRVKSVISEGQSVNSKIREIFEKYMKIHDPKNRKEILDFILNIIDELERVADYTINNYRNNFKNIYDWLKSSNSCNSKSNVKKVYIPILRGIENFKQTIDALQDKMPNLRLSLDESKVLDKYINQVDKMYQQKVQKTYFRNITNNLEIHTGEMVYEDIQKRLLGTEEERNIIREFEKFLSEKFFDKKRVTLIPNITQKYLYVNIDGEEYALHNLGEGIKQVIVIMYKMFIHKDEERLFFIEEPELNLHPGLQRKLIEAMLSEEFSNHQFFLTTHSNHLLDLILDYNNISIYKLNKLFLEDNTSRMKLVQVSKGDNSLLEELGVKSSSVFTSNCTIWIEGITDRLFIRKYLDLYQQYLINIGKLDKKLEEDIDYSFVEYSGSNLIHWNFDSEDSVESINSKYLSKHIFLVADNDFPKNGSRKNKNQEMLQEILKDNYYKLPVREIENLLSVSVLKKVICEREKKSNIVFKPDITAESVYKQEHMGLFINRRVNNRKHDYVKNGTNMLYNKMDFCNRSLKYLVTYDDMSEEAKKLTEKIYEFIISHK